VSIDGGAQANIATLPTYSNGDWIFTFSNTELTGKRISVRIVDSATKAVEDSGFNIETYGHANAQIVQDLGAATFKATDTDGEDLATAAALVEVGDDAAYISSVVDDISTSLDQNLDAAVSSRQSATQAATDKQAIIDAIGVDDGEGETASGVAKVLTFTDASSNYIADAEVWVTSDADGDTEVAGPKRTDSNGRVTFSLILGNQYYVWLRKDGVNPILGRSYVPAADD
jgi:hypothetical protein